MTEEARVKELANQWFDAFRNHDKEKAEKIKFEILLHNESFVNDLKKTLKAEVGEMDHRI